MAHSELDLRDRRKIEDMLRAKVPVDEIAVALAAHRSTIYRELKRNWYRDTELPNLNGYYALSAQDLYERRRAIHRKMVVHPELKAAIENRLKAGWSPKQIAGRMRLERHPISVSHETIYRFAYPGWPRRGVLSALPQLPPFPGHRGDHHEIVVRHGGRTSHNSG